jgi:two-component system sensor histidine kinase/response regulator
VVSAQGRAETVPVLIQSQIAQRQIPSRRLRVLLAEDNSVNQLVATRLLQKRGHHVVVTANGREALSALKLAALKNEPYDVVLMDVQMPEMDGIEATIALRELEKESGHHQPVVALTAMVIKGDRERCIAAGMDGYLSKPIRQLELDEILDGYTANLESTEEIEARLPPPESAVVDEAELMERVGNDLEFLSELTEVYRTEYPAQLASARIALANCDAKSLTQSTHAIRGALANLGATRASAAAFSIEEMAALSDFSCVAQTLDILEKEIQLVLTALESLCSGAAK